MSIFQVVDLFLCVRNQRLSIHPFPPNRLVPKLSPFLLRTYFPLPARKIERYNDRTQLFFSFHHPRRLTFLRYAPLLLLFFTTEAFKNINFVPWEWDNKNLWLSITVRPRLVIIICKNSIYLPGERPPLPITRRIIIVRRSFLLPIKAREGLWNMRRPAQLSSAHPETSPQQ